MKPYLISISILLTFLALRVEAQNPEVIKLADLKQLLKPESDTIYVINFWATWCKPCIQELPYFEQIDETFKDEHVKVILVSLDFKRHITTQLVPFLKKKKIKSQVLVLDEPDANLYIDMVDPSWSGAIPGTLIINKTKKFRKFYEKEFTYAELEKIIKPLIPE